MSEQYEFEGKTVEDAIAAGLVSLGVSREQVEIEVIRKGSRGILGFGGESAQVRLVPREIVQEAPATMEGDTVETFAEDASSVAESAWLDTPSESLTDDDQDANGSVTSLSDQGVSADEGPDGTFDNGSYTDDDYDESNIDVDDPEQLAAMATDFLEEMVDLMGYDAEVQAVWKDPEPDETESCLVLSVEGDDLGALIGRRGETLDSLQYLLRLMVNQKVRNWRNIVVDVAGYKEKRHQQISQLAQRMAEQVVETGRAVSLEPMPSNERRMVHLALRENPDVYTESSGESDRRKVHIMPKSLLD